MHDRRRGQQLRDSRRSVPTVDREQQFDRGRISARRARARPPELRARTAAPDPAQGSAALRARSSAVRRQVRCGDARRPDLRSPAAGRRRRRPRRSVSPSQPRGDRGAGVKLSTRDSRSGGETGEPREELTEFPKRAARAVNGDLGRDGVVLDVFDQVGPPPASVVSPPAALDAADSRAYDIGLVLVPVGHCTPPTS
jgi:hypothetical protein